LIKEKSPIPGANSSAFLWRISTIALSSRPRKSLSKRDCNTIDRERCLFAIKGAYAIILMHKEKNLKCAMNKCGAD
jgi:hypothetical protein